MYGKEANSRKIFTASLSKDQPKKSLVNMQDTFWHHNRFSAGTLRTQSHRTETVDIASYKLMLRYPNKLTNPKIMSGSLHEKIMMCIEYQRCDNLFHLISEIGDAAQEIYKKNNGSTANEKTTSLSSMTGARIKSDTLRIIKQIKLAITISENPKDVKRTALDAVDDELSNILKTLDGIKKEKQMENEIPLYCFWMDF